MKFPLLSILSVAALTLAGCAEKSDNIGSSYVSPLTYQSLSCPQIREEAVRISNRTAQLTGTQDKKAQNDAVATGVALVLFWPAAFLVKGDKQTASELARAKGELEALEQMSIRKNCGLTFRKAPPAET